MDENRENRFIKYLRKDRLPHIFCAGCGNGIIMNTFFNGMEMAEMDFEKVIMVSGIGCSSRIPGYVKCDSLHTTHGRPISFATGIKLANPQNEVIVDVYKRQFHQFVGTPVSLESAHSLENAIKTVSYTHLDTNNYSVYNFFFFS